MENLKVSLIQFNPKWNAIAENLQSLEISLAAYEGKCDLVVLPEMFSTGFNINPDKKLIDDQQKVIDWMRNIVKWSGFALTGSIVIERGGRLFNTMVMLTPDGDYLEYEKRHLFSFGREAEIFNAGDGRVDWIYKGWKIRPAICYDLRFPVWLRNDTEYDLLLICANWPAERIAHWNILLQARGIENLCYVIGCNRVGKEPGGLKYTGESSIYGFDGHPIMEMHNESMSKVIHLSKQELRKFRNQFNFLQDRDKFILPMN